MASISTINSIGCAVSSATCGMLAMTTTDISFQYGRTWRTAAARKCDRPESDAWVLVRSSLKER